MLKFIIFLIAAISFGYFAYINFDEAFGPANTSTACSADARVCPDGTAVGRSGPDCTFPACPK